MPAAHRPPPLQPTELKSRTKLRSVPTQLRIDAPAQPTAVALGVEETLSSALSDQSEADSFMPLKPKSLRNQKKLSLTLPSAHSNASSSSLSFPESPVSFMPAAVRPPDAISSRRRASVISLPNASASSMIHRPDEEPSPSAPYIDGPIQILPGIWIGSEDNARDWKCLVERGIKSILNVAKEVASPYPSVVPLRPTASTPNLAQAFSESQKDRTFIPAHVPSGRPPMHYLRLPWSHGQSDLVREGFVAAMGFVDEAVKRGDGVLIHCQCGVSRSATMVIALVMRAAQSGSPSLPQEVLALKSGGMHASYAFVKEKSKWVGPNMSLMYQLLEYERFLNSGNKSPTPSDRSSLLASEEAEWSRRRQELDEASQDGDEPESVELMREARALDLEMERRIVSRKSSQHSRVASVASNGSGIGMGTTWKSLHGHGGRSRAGSVASNFTNRSVLSEDLLEEDEDNTNTHDIHADSNSDTPSTDATEEEAQAPTHQQRSAFTPTTARPPPTAQAGKQSFGLLPSLPSRHTKTTLGQFLPPPSAPATKQSFVLSAPPNRFKKRRPPSLLPPVPPSPVSSKAPEVVEKKTMPRRARQVPPPLRIPSSISSRRSSSSSTAPAPTPSQTLIVFPQDQSVSTPSTMTLMSNLPAVPFPSLLTPRVSTFNKEGRRRSLISVGAPPTPTTACSRVDARGFFGP